MNSLIDWDSEELPPHVASFLKQKVEEKATKLLDRADSRANYDLLDEMEAEQNFGAFPLGYAPCNTTR